MLQEDTRILLMPFQTYTCLALNTICEEQYIFAFIFEEFISSNFILNTTLLGCDSKRVISSLACSCENQHFLISASLI